MTAEVEREHLEFSKRRPITRCPPGPTFHVAWGFLSRRDFRRDTEQDIISRMLGIRRRHACDMTSAAENRKLSPEEKRYRAKVRRILGAQALAEMLSLQ